MDTADRVPHGRLDAATTDGAFRLAVNGRPVFVKGFNWIPDDCFPARVTAARLRRAVRPGPGRGREPAAGLGRRPVREPRTSTTCADELGVLVWQDFPFACAAYPEEEPFRAEVEAEARENVARLTPHPSLVLWCGNNENIWGHATGAGAEALDGRSWGAGYYYDLLPRGGGRARPDPPVLARQPRTPAPRSATSMDDRPGTDPHLGRVEHRGLQPVRRLHPAVRGRVRLPGPARPTPTLRAAVSDDPLDRRLTRRAATTRRPTDGNEQAAARPRPRTCRSPPPSTTGTTSPS